MCCCVATDKKLLNWWLSCVSAFTWSEVGGRSGKSTSAVGEDPWLESSGRFCNKEEFASQNPRRDFLCGSYVIICARRSDKPTNFYSCSINTMIRNVVLASHPLVFETFRGVDCRYGDVKINQAGITLGCLCSDRLWGIQISQLTLTLRRVQVFTWNSNTHVNGENYDKTPIIHWVKSEVECSNLFCWHLQRKRSLSEGRKGIVIKTIWNGWRYLKACKTGFHPTAYV